MDKAAGESGGVAAETPRPPSRVQEAEQLVCGMAHDGDGFSGEVGDVDVLQGGECCTNDLPRWIHNLLKGFSVVVSAAPSCCGIITHDYELKSMNSSLTYQSEGGANCIFCGSFGSVCEQEGVQGGGGMDLI